MIYRGGKGLRKENDGNVNVIYYKKDKKHGFGVKNDSVVYYKQTEHTTCLWYDKPCLCGSLTHRTPRHRDCWLNNQYTNAIE